MVISRKLIEHISYCIICLVLVKADDVHNCALPLGMEKETIKDEAITTSLGNDGSGARLNRESAWCFKDSEVVEKEEVTLTIDLGQLTFVSGMKTQGPPQSLKDEAYAHHVGFYIKNSTSGDQWSTCCGSQTTMFYGEDTLDKSEEVKIHPFGMLILARKIRLSIKTGVRWPGDSEKCFRLELLGCSEELVPLTNLKLTALPSGWIEATWDIPSVMIPGIEQSQSYNLEINEYNATLQRAETTEGPPVSSSTFFVEARRVMVPSPIWGAIYSLSLICHHQGRDLPCEKNFVIATVQGCDPAESTCQQQYQVTFRRPQEIKSWTVRASSSSPSSDSSNDVFLSWTAEGPGWVTTNTRITVTNQEGKEVISVEVDNKSSSKLLQSLVGSQFNVTFTPQANTLRYAPSFAYELYIIEWSSLKPDGSKRGFGAFITDVKLEANIQWEGMMIVTWSPALVREGDLVADIDLTSEYTATANLYNVSIMEEKKLTSLQSKTITGGSELKLQFPHLKMETVYNINVSCDYGGVIVQCGFSSIFTGLPIGMIEMDSQMHIYVGRAGGEHWTKQEKSCEKGDGTLVTFGTEEEEELIRPKLYNQGSYNSFWIGLNMCPDNKGDVWSDGSRWIYSLLPHTDSGLSSATCCIKSVWSSIDQRYIWYGESCGALLPAICEYKPTGLVGEISDLSRMNATTSSAAYEWSYVEEFWTPTGFNHQICPVLNLTTFTKFNSTNNKRCIVKLTPFDEKWCNASNLEPFTEYNVSVSGSLPSLGFKGKNRSLLVRTLHAEPVLLNLLGNGFIDIKWAEKISNFEEEEAISVIVQEGPNLNEKSRQTLPANRIRLRGLQLGSQYMITLEERTGLKRKEIRNVTAYPPCNCKDCQDLGICITPSNKQVPHSLAISQCTEEDKNLAVSKTKETLELLLKQAEKVVDDLWISSSSTKGKGDTRPGTIALQTDNQDAATTTAPTLPVEECLLVSRSTRAIVAASDCQAVHYAACEKQAPLPAVFPSESQIETRIGGTWLSFNWDANGQGWNTKYSIYYKPTLAKRFERNADYKNFESPPVVIENLEKSTSYTVELIADLGQGFLSPSQEIVRITSTSNAPPSSGRMSAAYFPSPEHYLAHLICGAFLVVACITTMLLFFAAGMFYQDCMAQLGFLFSLLVAYLLLLVAHPRGVDDEAVVCVVVSTALHYFFLTAFLFLCLEALTISHLLVKKIQSPFQISNWLLMITGFLLPLIYVTISAGIINAEYPNPSESNCWLNVEGVVLYVQSVPNGIVFLFTVIFILLTCASNIDNQPILKDGDIRGRQSDSYKLRWVVLALAIELGVAWSAGSAGYHLKSSLPHVIHIAFTVLLALTILFARTALDDTFRAKIHRLCCGTELTYKRSAIQSINARARVAPNANGKPDRVSSGFSTTTVMTTSQKSNTSQFSLPNTPPQSDLSNTILIKRSYKFEDDD